MNAVVFDQMKYKATTILLLTLFLFSCSSGGKIETADSNRTDFGMPSEMENAKTASANVREAAEIARVKNPSDETPENMIFIEGGTFKMGSNHGMPSEAPVHEVTLDSFWIDKHEVTVAEFAEFVDETGYVTEGEKIGWSGVFDKETGEWTRCDGVSWRTPDCGDKKADKNEPVTMVSWNDANAYAKWANKRLPTEAEFEFAARGGLEQNEYAWGNELRPNGKPAANWWQGNFPDRDTKEDGYNGRAPVMSFAPNGYGLYDMAGNVWEWTSDWYADDYYKRGKKENPAGAKSGEEKTIRGGSWLCAENYCTNYRAAGRSHSPTDSALNNLGFRLVRDK